jgi:uncharacterized damage-inducible protein DinB
MESKALLSELLERELAISRRLLARVPEGRSDWKPHDKSMALGYLATLVAVIPDWMAMQIERDELDLAPIGGKAYTLPTWQTGDDLARIAEESTARARAALAATTEAHLATSWRLQVSGQTVAESSRHSAIADTLCHAAHHRGQLSVYLRLLDVPLPSIYGPSADDRSF